MKHNKLVRDKIPDIIARYGGRPVTKRLDADGYRRALQRKLQEEVSEFAASGKVEELADILEVVYALAEVEGVSRTQLEEMGQRKREDRGGFAQRILLIETIDE